MAEPTREIIHPDQALPPHLLVLPVDAPTIFPTLIAPILLESEEQARIVEEAIQQNRMLGLLQTRAPDESDRPGAKSPLKPEDLHETGVVVRVIKRLKMPDGSVNVLVHSIKRFKAKKVLSEFPNHVVEAEYLDDVIEKTVEFDAMMRAVVGSVKKLSEVNPFFTDEMRMAMINAPNPGVVADLVAFSLSLPKEEAQKFLETTNVRDRFEQLLLHLRQEQDLADVQKRISDDVNTKIGTLQREFFLKEQLKSIKRELGMEEDGKEKTARTFRERLETSGMPPETLKTALEELEKFETLSESSPEYNISRTYLETVCSLPWSKASVDQLDPVHAKEVLDEDHYGLEKVKERILEFLAVRKLKNDRKGSIICLVGPPGVGKTSVGRSIAKTLGREFFRFSVGGMRDEAEIKGHRRTYIGALPGKLITGVRRAGTKNPVLLLDEIDKLAQSYQGDPASALLEALDPEQNSTFLDHYLDLPFDLSQVLFITTANSTQTIPGPLLDRMEVIEIPGYTLEEKEDIALRYLIPRERENAGLKPEQLTIARSALRTLVRDYAREPGVRGLQKHLAQLSRKAAARIVSSGRRKSVVIDGDELTDWLGPKKYMNEVAERVNVPGVVTGLAWTSAGGDILFIEAIDVPGTGQLKLTGQMGAVMNESAAIAWTAVKKRAIADLGIPAAYFRENDFHLHIPAGGIPKDGPSAGITLATTLYSLFSGEKVRGKLAMTGELSLTGKVLPVGGIKEKLLAAQRAGIQEVFLPEANRRDLADIPETSAARLRQDLELHWVKTLDEVLAAVFPKKTKPLGVFRRASRKSVLKTRDRLSPLRAG